MTPTNTIAALDQLISDATAVRQQLMALGGNVTTGGTKTVAGSSPRIGGRGRAVTANGPAANLRVRALAVFKRGPITVRAVATELGVTPTKLSPLIPKLKSEHVIVKAGGSGLGTTYRAV